MSIFNTRKDVEYYEIKAYDKNWNGIPAVITPQNPVQIPYLGKGSIAVYIRELDLERATYICSRSRLTKSLNKRPLVESRICSKRVE
jgi:hypothetical protein